MGVWGPAPGGAEAARGERPRCESDAAAPEQPFRRAGSPNSRQVRPGFPGLRGLAIAGSGRTDIVNGSVVAVVTFPVGVEGRAVVRRVQRVGSRVFG